MALVIICASWKCEKFIARLLHWDAFFCVSMCFDHFNHLFSSPHLGHLIYCQKSCVLERTFEATDAKMLRVSMSTTYDMINVALQCFQEFGG